MDGPTTEQAELLLRWFKDGPPGAIPIATEGRTPGCLQAVTWEDAGDPGVLGRLSRWHDGMTPTAARRWLVGQVLPACDRVLFWVKDGRGEPAGHVALTRLDLAARTAAVGFVASSDVGAERLVGAAVATLTLWARETFGVNVQTAPARRVA